MPKRPPVHNPLKGLPGAKKRVRAKRTNQTVRGKENQDRRDRFLRLHPTCAQCEREGLHTVATEVDHVRPLFEGGPDTWSNLQGLCDACHMAKSNAERSRARKRKPDDPPPGGDFNLSMA